MEDGGETPDQIQATVRQSVAEWMTHIRPAGTRDEMATHLVEEFGKHSHPACEPRAVAVQKVQLFESLLQFLCTVPVVDPRIAEREIKVIHINDQLYDEERPPRCFLRKYRGFDVHDPLAFWSAFSELQTRHPDYPRPSPSHTFRSTKGISQPLKSLGLGLPVTVFTHDVQYSRGPANTDPEKELRDGRWQTIRGKRDQLYYTRCPTLAFSAPARRARVSAPAPLLPLCPQVTPRASFAAPRTRPQGVGAWGMRRVRLVRREGRGMPAQYGGRDESCPISTGGRVASFAAPRTRRTKPPCARAGAVRRRPAARRR